MERVHLLILLILFCFTRKRSETLVPVVDGEYILKFRDDGGRPSSGETSVVVTTPDPLPKLSVFVDREDTDVTPFGGTKVNTFLILLLADLF